MSVSLVVSLGNRWLSRAWLAVTIARKAVCCPQPSPAGSMPRRGAIKVLKKGSHTPKFTEATTNTSPSRLNHAVAQPQPLPPRMELQW